MNSKNKLISKKIRWLIIIAVLLAAVLLFFNSAKFVSSQNNQTRAKNLEIFDFNPSSAENGSLVAKVDELKAGYLRHQNYEWQSAVIKADFPFSALGANWNKDEKSKIEIFVRFSQDSKNWEEWQKFISDDDDQANEKSLAGQSSSLDVADLLFSKDAKYWQYKVVFADKINSSELLEIKFTYIDPSNSADSFSLLKFLGLKRAKAVNSPRVISRDEWGADPGLMTWPPEYARPNKIIIHHTASGNNPPDPAAVVRSIYYYHAVSLGWGDIGYNYLFDQNGNIYEGRAGGNGSIGAHAYGQNTGSIGFSAIGNFSGENIAPATFEALSSLAAFEAYLNDFDLNFGTVFGHRDFCNNPPGHNCTACPGDVLYGRKGEIIDNARQKESTYLQRDRDFLNQNNNVLVKSYSQDTIYLWTDGSLRPIADMATLLAFDYSLSNLNYISLAALAEKPLGEKISALLKTAADPNVYLIFKNPDKKYLIPNPEIFSDYGFVWGNIAVSTQDELSNIPSAGSLTKIIKAEDNPSIYRLSQGKKSSFADPQTLTSWGYDFSQVTTLKPSFVGFFPQGPVLYNLIKGSGPSIYLMQAGKKSFIPNPAIFNAWKFDWSHLTILSDSEINNFTAGPNLSRIAQGSGPQIFLIDQGAKYQFPDSNIVNYWLAAGETIFQANQLLLNNLGDGSPVTPFIKDPNGPTVYMVFKGAKYGFPDPLTFFAWDGDWSKIRVYSPELTAEIPAANITLSRFVQKETSPQEPETYLISIGKKRLIPDSTTYSLWTGNNITPTKLPPELFNFLPNDSAVSLLIKGSGPEIFFIEKGRRDPILNMDVFSAWGFTMDKVTLLSDNELSSIPQGNPLTNLVKNETEATVYKVAAGKKSAIPSPAEFFCWGFSFNNISVLDATALTLLTDDDPLSIFARTEAADPNIYLLDKTNKKLIPEGAVQSAWLKDKTISISQLINNLPTQGNATQLIKSGAPEIYYISEGQRFLISDWATFVAWGFRIEDVTILSPETINALPDGGLMTRLFKGSAETVYYLDAGQKRPIPNLDVFFSWGWSFANVRLMPDSWVNQLPTGQMMLPNANLLSITANGSYSIIKSSGENLGSLNAGERSYAAYYNGFDYVIGGSISSYGAVAFRFTPNSEATIMEISSYSDPNYNGSTNYNRFRGMIEITHSGSGTWAVNELSLNDYTAGICEAPGGHPEYLKTMAVAARSYGLWHLSRGGKHAGEPFILKNSRQGNGNDQLYCGYAFEAIASSYAPQARATDNQVVLYNGAPILAAYSHGSYPRTLSALEVWGTDYPYLQSVDDPFGDPARPCGSGGNHCVGLSASGAIGYAETGSNYLDILRHYYSGADVGSIGNQYIRIAIYSF